MDTRSELNLSELGKILWERKLILLVLFIIVFFTVLQISFLMPSTFSASAKLIVRNEYDLYPPLALPWSTDEVFLTTQSKILSSRPILNKALEDVKDKGLAKEIGYNELKRKLSVKQENNSSILELRLEHENKEEAVALVNSISAAFIDYHVNAKKELTGGNLDSLTKEVNLAKNDLKDLEIKLKNFHDKDLVNFYQAQIPYFVDNIIEIDKINLSTTADIGRIQKELDKIEVALEKGGSEVLYPLTPHVAGQTSGEHPTASLMENPWVTDVKLKLRDAQAYLGSVLAKYTTEHPEAKGAREYVYSLEADLDKEIKNVLKAYRDYYDGYIDFLKYNKKERETERKEYKAELDKLSKEIDNAAARQIEFNALLKNYDVKESVYVALLHKQKDLEILKEKISNSSLPNIKIFESASLPLKRARPNIPLNLALGAFFGIAIGTSGALIAEKKSFSREKYKGRPVEFPVMKEKRSMSRLDMVLNVTYEFRGDVAHIKNNALSKNISGSGIKITTDKPLSKNTQLFLEIHLNSKDSIKATAEVVWVTYHEDARMFECGLYFVNIEPAEREKLINYLYKEHYLQQKS